MCTLDGSNECTMNPSLQIILFILFRCVHKIKCTRRKQQSRAERSLSSKILLPTKYFLPRLKFGKQETGVVMDPVSHRNITTWKTGQISFLRYKAFKKNPKTNPHVLLTGQNMKSTSSAKTRVKTESHYAVISLYFGTQIFQENTLGFIFSQ